MITKEFFIPFCFVFFPLGLLKRELQAPMSWAGCPKNPIDVNFHLRKSLEMFEKKFS